MRALLLVACSFVIGCVNEVVSPLDRPDNDPGAPDNADDNNDDDDPTTPIDDGEGEGPAAGGEGEGEDDVDPPPPPPPEEGIPALGNGGHTLDDVDVTVIGTNGDGLNGPRDLAFNPAVSGSLWVVNQNDDSTVRFDDVGTSSQTSDHQIDPYALHFMDEVSSLAFSNNMKFATCQESRNTYNGTAEANDFMGPTLWTSDLAIYAQTNPNAEWDLGVDLGSHIDMLHESPNCMGIAWESANIYWTADGLSGTISRYDFQHDHGPGYDDHSDGRIQRLVDVDFTRVPNVPSHLTFDQARDVVLLADTGGARVIEIDPSTMSYAYSLEGIEPGTTLEAFEDAGQRTIAHAADGLSAPSGLAVRAGVVYVGDNDTGRISAFDQDSGALLDYLDTELPSGALMGIAVDDTGAVWAVDFLGDRVLRYRAL